MFSKVDPYTGNKKDRMIMISLHPEIRITVLAKTPHKASKCSYKKIIRKYKNYIQRGNSHLQIGKTFLWLNGPHFLAFSNPFPSHCGCPVLFI